MPLPQPSQPARPAKDGGLTVVMDARQARRAAPIGLPPPSPLPRTVVSASNAPLPGREAVPAAPREEAAPPIPGQAVDLLPKPRPPGSGLLGLRAFGQKPIGEHAAGHLPSSPLGLPPVKSSPPGLPPVKPERLLAPPEPPLVPPGAPQGGSGRMSGARQRGDSEVHWRRPRGLWIGVVAGVLALALSLAIGLFFFATRSRSSGVADGRTPSATPVSLPPATVLDSDAGPRPFAQLDAMSSRVHQLGQESPELRALLDLQSRLAARCMDDPATCGHGWTPFSREAVDPIDAGALVHRKSDGPMSAWLQRLKLPRDFPLRDGPTLRGVFDFNTKNIAGRQRFQTRLFACSAYGDIFESTLEKYGAPLWLIAVVYQESGCEPFATSQTGARGLWQFMPESARAYALKVVDGEIDERLNPVKSTEAAIHFLTDLRRQVGAWDLALAAYNMGPYGLMARIVQVGGDAGFWDLVEANLLPDETAGYVPAIEAYAIILENLGRLEFSRDGKRLESTAEIMAKPGVRLSFIARAAHTSTLRIRELNPEFLRDAVPDGETSVRVPDSEAHRAQLFLESTPPSDDRDTCVPEDFDWGLHVFDTSKYAATCHAAEDGHGGGEVGPAGPLPTAAQRSPTAIPPGASPKATTVHRPPAASATGPSGIW